MKVTKTDKFIGLGSTILVLILAALLILAATYDHLINTKSTIFNIAGVIISVATIIGTGLSIAALVGKIEHVNNEDVNNQ